VLDVLSTIAERLAGIDAKLDQALAVVVEAAEDVGTLRSRMIEQASRDGEERRRHERAVAEIESRLRPLESDAEDDPLQRRIRELREYSGDDDPDSSVQIQALPGSVVNVRASSPDSDRPLSVKDWKKTAVRIAGALVGLATMVKAIWEATK